MEARVALLFQSIEDVTEIEVSVTIDLPISLTEFHEQNEPRQVRYCVESGNPYIKAVHGITQWTDILVLGAEVPDSV